MSFETDHTKEPVCPNCGHKEKDAWEINFRGLDGDVEHTCNSCGEEYFLTRHVSIRYSSEKLKAKATDLPRTEE